MPKTIKEVLENLAANVETERANLTPSVIDTTAYVLKIDTYVDTALTEIRQILKEAEPEIIKPESFNFSRDNAIREYTANIEKILNLTDSLPLNGKKRLG